MSILNGSLSSGGVSSPPSISRIGLPKLGAAPSSPDFSASLRWRAISSSCVAMSVASCSGLTFLLAARGRQLRRTQSLDVRASPDDMSLVVDRAYETQLALREGPRLHHAARVQRHLRPVGELGRRAGQA